LRVVALAFVLIGCATPQSIVTHQTALTTSTSSVSFAICGDMRSDRGPIVDGALTEQGKIFQAIAKEPFTFVLNTGDLVTRGEDPRDWAIFDALTAPLEKAGLPYFPVIGNHEYLGKNAAALKHYFARFPGLEEKKWYVLRAPPLSVIVLDSNLDKLSPEERSAQRRFEKKALLEAQADREVRFVALAFHHPPYTNGPHAPAAEAYGELVTPARGHDKVRLVINGHVHSYERFEREGLTFVVSGGCGAPPYPVEIDPRAWRFPAAYLGPAERGYHWLSCSAGDRLGCRVMTLEGDRFQESDRFELTAPSNKRTIEGYDD
jgi:3',5'-cyclic AMP phosphodiesterase CpdA